MSIKKSLRLSLILLSSLPLIFMAVLTYIVSYNKYFELAKNSATELASTYSDGFTTQLDMQIAQIEGLAHGANIQAILLESYNGVALGSDSAYYDATHNLLKETSTHMSDYVSFYVYDINGYFIVGSEDIPSGDWEEYMDIPISDIDHTMIMRSSNINKNERSIEIVSPVIVKNKIIGLIRSNISAEFFGDFMPESGDAFIMTNDSEYLFSSTGLSEKPELEESANELFISHEKEGFLQSNSLSISNIYGYSYIDNLDWLYIIKQDGSQYTKVLKTLPVILFVTLALFLGIAGYISYKLAHRYTDPIIELKDNMKLAADGKLDIKSDITSNDEFGELSEMFNIMMNIISNNYNQLNESKKILEENEIELKKNYAHIEKLAYHDGLTGLYNRVAFMKYAFEIFHKSSAQFSRHAIFFIDLDNFKNVNDTLGHDYGDLLLKQVSDKLSNLTSDKDILARTGGDEFLILRTDYKSEESLKEFANSLISIVDYPFNLEDEEAHVSMSIGIALFPTDGLTINELIKNADIAMYNAKNAGKNNFRFFNSYMEDDVTRRNDLADILANVIEKDEVYLMYQPQVDVKTGAITGFEALMRINSDLAGNISPTEFIPIAEDSGMINQLGEWALYEACRFNQALIHEGFNNIKVSVNVSTTQLKDESLLDIIKSIPDVTGMDLSHLEIEITESVLMNSFEHNLKLINAMKALGCSIALDDFGTGYSSFNYLTRIPIDTLKIDKSFIDGICKNPKDRCIADSIISLAHKMNITVVAEGVEVVEQLRILESQLCDTIQGYLFSKPLSANDFVEMLNDFKTK